MMAFVRLALFPAATRAHYDEVAALLSDVPTPRERLLFAAGPVEGGWQVVQVWTSRSHLEAFNQEHFLPALASLGPGAFPRPPVVTDFNAVDVAVSPSPDVTGRDGTASA